MTAPEAAERRTIRRALAADAAALAVLNARCLPGAPWSAAAIERLLAAPAGIGYLAEQPAPALGFCLARIAADECEVVSLCVLPERRRAGLGRQLLEACLAEAGTRGCTVTFLEVAEDNGPALALYESLGFAPVGRRRAYYAPAPGTGRDALVLRRGGTPASG